MDWKAQLYGRYKGGKKGRVASLIKTCLALWKKLLDLEPDALRRDAGVCLLIIATTVFAYWQAPFFDFISLDDGLYVSRNFHLKDSPTWHGIVWAFTDIHYAGFWHPLTWLSLMLDYRLFGLNASGYHWTNLMIHTVNALLLFFIFRQMTGEMWKSAFVAALFALHPLNVESVAWISERKNVLSTLFWFLTIGVYLSYIKSPGRRRHIALLTTFSLGLMAKPMLVTLPFVLLLLDLWPLGRLRALDAREAGGLVADVRLLVKEKIPLFLLAILFSVLTFAASLSRGALMSLESLTFTDRLGNALISYTKYIGKLFYPFSLAVFYPLASGFHAWQIAAAALLLMAITALAIGMVKKQPYLFVGWFWYLGTLVPVIGLIQVGSHSMADRYAYHSIIGLFIMLVWGASELAKKWPYWQKPLFLLPWGIAAILLAITWRQVGYWQNSVALFSHAISVTDRNYLAHDNLGLALMEQGKVDEARYHFEQALRILPRNPSAYNNLGNLSLNEGQLEEAISWYREALKINPNFSAAVYNLGTALLRTGKIMEAEFYLKEAINVDAGNFDAHVNLGVALAAQERVPEAIRYFQDALRINPYSREAAQNLQVLQGQSKGSTGSSVVPR